jgi:hypothetical protein
MHNPLHAQNTEIRKKHAFQQTLKTTMGKHDQTWVFFANLLDFVLQATKTCSDTRQRITQLLNDGPTNS